MTKIILNILLHFVTSWHIIDMRGGINMVSEQQAEIARAFTKSSLCTAGINLEVQDTPEEVKNERCLDVDAAAKEYDMPFDKAFPDMFGSFTAIAKKAYMDPASLFCVYMEWKNRK
jgi:hypothetical protein